MKLKDIKIGMKVIPHGKTPDGRNNGLKYSNVWRKAQEKKQLFLYVVKIPLEGDYPEVVLSEEYHPDYTEFRDGDYFHVRDFNKYEGI